MSVQTKCNFLLYLPLPFIHSLYTVSAGCAPGWTPFEHTGRCYKLLTGAVSWAAARSVCAEHQGDLASVPDQVTNDFLSSLSTASAWLGGSAADSAGWTWSDGTPWGHTNWSPGHGQPHNQAGDQDYLVLEQSSGLWYDEGNPEQFICQYEPGKIRYISLFLFRNLCLQCFQPWWWQAARGMAVDPHSKLKSSPSTETWLHASSTQTPISD